MRRNSDRDEGDIAARNVILVEDIVVISSQAKPGTPMAELICEAGVPERTLALEENLQKYGSQPGVEGETAYKRRLSTACVSTEFMSWQKPRQSGCSKKVTVADDEGKTGLESSHQVRVNKNETHKSTD